MNQLKLRTKLYLAGSLLVAVAIVVGAIGIIGLHRTNEGLETVYNDRVVPLKQLKAIADDYAVAIIDAANKANAGLFTAEETLHGLETASANINRNWKAYRATFLTPEETKLANEADTLFAPADAAVEKFRQHLSGKHGSLKGALSEFDGPLYQHIDPISSKIGELVELQLRVAHEEHEAAHARFITILWLASGTLALGTFLGTGCSWLIVRNATRVLRHVSESLALGATQTAAAAHEVSSSSQSLAEGASEQAASLEETSASLEEVSSMTKRNAQNAHQAKELASQTKLTAETSVASTREMSRAMAGIRDASGELRDAMNGIKAASADVSKIIKTIDEIAFQTNILALNAAVEAARAGEAGMGFAVVADEVRNLAQRSAQAARETTDMIETSIRRGEDGVRVTEKVNAAVEGVVTKSTELEAKLGEILEKARQMDDQVGQIAGASAEQSQGISQVSTAVSEMDKVTQLNAASAEESASAAAELNAQAESMRSSALELEALVNGQPTTTAPATPKTTPHPNPPPPAHAPKKLISAVKTGSNGTHRPATGMVSPAKATQGALVAAHDDFKDF